MFQKIHKMIDDQSPCHPAVFLLMTIAIRLSSSSKSSNTSSRHVCFLLEMELHVLASQLQSDALDSRTWLWDPIAWKVPLGVAAPPSRVYNTHRLNIYVPTCNRSLTSGFSSSPSSPRWTNSYLKTLSYPRKQINLMPVASAFPVSTC